MSPSSPNQVRPRRIARRWSQAELASRSGVSRTGISAIEVGRLIPSVAAALSIARALECRVEDLFGNAEDDASQSTVLWGSPPSEGRRYWRAKVGGRTVAFPTEAATAEIAWHDGVVRKGLPIAQDAAAEDTLIIACCDPAVGLLATEYARTSRFRMVAIRRSSQEALELLRDGLVHAAGLHFSGAHRQASNRRVARLALSSGFSLVHVARWQEGLAVARNLRSATTRGLLHDKRIRWVGREEGSGARQCLDRVLAGRPAPQRLARNHQGVAEAIASGWADVGVCLRLPSEEAGLRFISVRQEDYELCIPEAHTDDPRVAALVDVLGSSRYRRLLGELPGYNSRNSGDVKLG